MEEQPDIGEEGEWFTSMMEEQLDIGEEGEWFTSMMEEQLDVGEEGGVVYIYDGRTA